MQPPEKGLLKMLRNKVSSMAKRIASLKAKTPSRSRFAMSQKGVPFSQLSEDVKGLASDTFITTPEGEKYIENLMHDGDFLHLLEQMQKREHPHMEFDNIEWEKRHDSATLLESLECTIQHWDLESDVADLGIHGSFTFIDQNGEEQYLDDLAYLIAENFTGQYLSPFDRYSVEDLFRVDHFYSEAINLISDATNGELEYRGGKDLKKHQPDLYEFLTEAHEGLVSEIHQRLANLRYAIEEYMEYLVQDSEVVSEYLEDHEQHLLFDPKHGSIV